METGDPDDFLTLIMLLGHPRVNLKAVTVTPGTKGQVGLVKWACDRFGRQLPIGSFNPHHDKNCVSAWHYNTFGNIPEAEPADIGGAILKDMCDEHTILVTGGPLKNVGVAMDLEFKVGELVAQGGFAGDGVVPLDKQLPKFRGMATCPTYNLNGDPKSALRVLEYAGIPKRWFVSKNVCHGVVYDQALHERVGEVKDKSLSLSLIHQGMGVYLAKNREGKKFHDPLAACCAIDRSIGVWEEVMLYRSKGEWGSKLCEGTGTRIIVGYDCEKFIDTLTET
jgi:pyrimidine-specific ribonucleoside hydrolase